MKQSNNYIIIISWLIFSCEEVDECTEGTNNCDDSSRAVCTNTIGSFTCNCSTPFMGNGTYCTMVSALFLVVR